MSRTERHKRALEGVYTLQNLKVQHKWTSEDRYLILRHMDLVRNFPHPNLHIVSSFYLARIDDDLLSYSFCR